MILFFRWSLIVFSILWSLMVLPAEAVRVLYADIRGDIATGKPVERADLDSAIAAYQKVASLKFCMPGVREQLASFLSIRPAMYTGADALVKVAADLDLADKTLRVMLTCSPFESNQWLSLAMLDVRRNGVRDRVFKFLNLSYLTGPREAWILERRLTFAAGIAPLIPAELKTQIQADIDELRRMGSTRKRFLERLRLKSMDELELLFG